MRVNPIAFPLEGETGPQGRIVQVEVMERRGDTVRLRINQVETTARTSREVPPAFLALAEVVHQEHGLMVKLTPLEWLGKEALFSHQEKSLLSMVAEELVALGITSLEEYLPWGYTLAKRGLPVNRTLLEQVRRLSRHYDQATLSWILSAVRHGFPPTEEVADFLRHITAWLRATAREQEAPSSAKETIPFLEQASIPPWVVSLFGSFPWTQDLFGLWEHEESLVIARQHHAGKGLEILIEDDTVGRWIISLEWASHHLRVSISMDPMIWEKWKDAIERWAKESQKRWGHTTDREVVVMAKPWEDPWQFFLPPEPALPVRGINLYA